MLNTPSDPSAARDRLCWPDANEQKTPGLVSPIHKLWTLTSGSADALMPKPEAWWRSRTYFKPPEVTAKVENVRKENVKYALLWQKRGK